MGAYASKSGGDFYLHPAAFDGAASHIFEHFKAGESEISYLKAAEILGFCDRACFIAETQFPGSKDSKIILEESKIVLEKNGLSPENTLFAQSICPDEINHEHGDITGLFSKYMGEVFHIGGLAGIPFTGKTGFAAFSHHVPDGGHMFILFAPHIGISDALQLGKYDRDGMSTTGAACGAAVGALAHCCGGGAIPDHKTLGENPSDYQMNYIISEINKVASVIDQHEVENDRMRALTEENFKICDRFINQIVNEDIKCASGKPIKIVLLGGVQINMPRPLSDYFQPLRFEIREKGKATKNLMNAFSKRRKPQCMFNTITEKALKETLEAAVREVEKVKQDGV